MNDIILVEGLEICCVVGIHPHERLYPQKVVVDLDIAIPVVEHEDILNETVDYAHASEMVTQLFVEQQYETLEFAGQEIIAQMFKRWPVISSIKCTMRKPNAVYAARNVGVVMYRERA